MAIKKINYKFVERKSFHFINVCTMIAPVEMVMPVTTNTTDAFEIAIGKWPKFACTAAQDMRIKWEIYFT